MTAEIIDKQTEIFLATIGKIYDAIFDPALWPCALEKAARFVGGSAAALTCKDAFGRPGDIVHQVGIDAHFKTLYLQKYAVLASATVEQHCADISEPIATADIIYDEFLRSRFYLEWARPQQFVDVITVIIEKSARGTARFDVFRHERDGIVDEETRARMRLIAPHVRRSVLVHRLIDLKTNDAANFGAALDSLTAAMLLVDASGRIIHANTAGHLLLHRKEILRLAGGCIVPTDLAAQQTLYEVLAAAGRGRAAWGANNIPISLTDCNEESYLAHILPLTSGARRQRGFPTRAASIIFVHKATLNFRPPFEVLAKRFRLTPAELRVLFAIVEVGGAPEVADLLGIGKGTVKTHLKRIYAKTSGNRHVDLVKLVAAFSNPLVALT